MVRRIDDGWVVLGRTDGQQKLYPCYFCSRETPKLRTGWQVQLADGQTITVGPDCGKSHLGDRFTIDRRKIEKQEEEAAAWQRRNNWVSLRDRMAASADAIIAHEGCQRLADIKEQALFMHPRARKHLTDIAEGRASGVRQFHIFEHGGPRQRARTISRLTAALAAAPREARNLNDLCRKLDAEVRAHNERLDLYAAGLVAFEAASLETINRELPMVHLAVDDGELIMTRKSDGMTRTLPLPTDLRLPAFPHPRGSSA